MMMLLRELINIHILPTEDGEESEKANNLKPVLDPAARWSSERVPEVDSAAAAAPHALVGTTSCFSGSGSAAGAEDERLGVRRRCLQS